MENVDVGKIFALKGAGWSQEEIAADMHVEQEVVEKIISGSAEIQNKETGSSQKDEEGKEDAHVFLTVGQLKDIYEKAATIGAKEALKTFEQERKRQQGKRASRRLKNTKLLLRNYHMLKEHAENSVFGRTQMEESALDILESMMSMYDNEVIIESIKRSATRTAIIVAHIDTMFGLYEAYCDKSSNRQIDRRRYDVVWDMYMADRTLTVKEIAEKQHLSRDTIYDDLKVAVERLTSLIFGVDGLNVR